MSIIAIDGDGVLLDYNAAYPFAWERAFGIRPIEKNAHGYSVFDRWDIPMLAGSELQKLKACFDEKFWSTIPAMPGALDACQLLTSRGYELVCVTALSQQFAPARLKNLKDLGFPIERVIATPGDSSQGSPKARTLFELAPIAFVDDFLPYMIGVDERIHRALITRDPIGSPNVGPGILAMSSTHHDLLDFADWWSNQ